MVAAFDIAGVNRKGAVFDEPKLEWLNSQYIQDLPGERLAEVVRPYLQGAGLMSADLEPGGTRRDWYLRVLEILKARSRRLTDFPRDARPFLGEEYDLQLEAVAKYLTAEKSGGPRAVAARLKALAGVLRALEPFDDPATEAALRDLASQRGDSAALYIHPMRVALLGTAVGPSAFAVLVLFGKERATARLEAVANRLESGEFRTPEAG
jgi:glutamyl/glutaminyl-tRNA synthetase